jgi:hypothetical protein
MQLRTAPAFFLLTLFTTCIFLSCDSGGTSSPKSPLQFPAQGNSGPNLLSGEVDTAVSSEDQSYSVRAEVVGKIDSVGLCIEMVGDNAQDDFWTRSVSRMVGWRATIQRGTFEVWSLRRETGDAQIALGGTDTLRLRVFEGRDSATVKEALIPWKEPGD